jgi:NAD(P)-dependent dehydrogenase (short-subunit alcohol dehydrogenase family)
MSNTLGSKVAAVTGASPDIGSGTAERLVADGANVSITSGKQESLDDALTVLGGPGHRVTGQIIVIDRGATLTGSA